MLELKDLLQNMGLGALHHGGRLQVDSRIGKFVVDFSVHGRGCCV
jgi:hypothetical protein